MARADARASGGETFDNIQRLLKKHGFLIILEDRYLPKGESAHEFGYLILGPSQIKTLFNDNEIIHLQLEDPAYKDRLVFCAIQQPNIRVYSSNVRDAISSLEQECFFELKKMRSSTKKDLAYGRMYANLTQLYINAKMVLENNNSLFSSF